MYEIGSCPAGGDCKECLACQCYGCSNPMCPEKGHSVREAMAAGGCNMYMNEPKTAEKENKLDNAMLALCKAAERFVSIFGDVALMGFLGWAGDIRITAMKYNFKEVDDWAADAYDRGWELHTQLKMEGGVK